MSRSPLTYNQFKNIRYQPFLDLMGMIVADNLKTIPYMDRLSESEQQ